jgi:hypothetical protein
LDRPDDVLVSQINDRRPLVRENRMVSFRFTDQRGVSWMVLPSLPVDYPDTGEGPGLPRGFTFRSDRGELRVLPRAAIPRGVRFSLPIRAMGAQSRVPPVDGPYWEELLARSIAWPPS